MQSYMDTEFKADPAGIECCDNVPQTCSAHEDDDRHERGFGGIGAVEAGAGGVVVVLAGVRAHNTARTGHSQRTLASMATAHARRAAPVGSCTRKDARRGWREPPKAIAQQHRGECSIKRADGALIEGRMIVAIDTL